MSYTGSKAQSGRNTIVAIGPRSDATGSATFVPIGEVKSASTSGAKWNTEGVGNFDSGVDMEFRKTIRDNGTKSLSGNRVSSEAGQLAAKAAYDDPDGAYLFTITYPKVKGQSTGDVDSFTAIVESWDQVIEFDKIITFTLGLKQSGPTVTTPGTLITP